MHDQAYLACIVLFNDTLSYSNLFLCPLIFQIFSNRAQCYINLGALPQGLEDAEKCIELDPTFLKGYVRKAKVQFLLGDYENAMATYQEGMRCDPNNPEVLDGLKR
jgi:tetratricopeptide (TPR) repeat protein